MAWTNNPYCTLAQIKSAMNLDPTNTTLDAWIQSDVLPEAQEQVDDYLGFSYQSDGTAQAPSTRLYSGRGSRLLIIDECQQVTQVLESTYDPILGSSQQFILAPVAQVDITADCVLGPDNVIPGISLRRLTGAPFEEGIQNFTVRGVWGYTTIPREIERATIRLCVHMLKMRDTNYADGLNQTGGQRLKYTKRLPEDVVEILDRKQRRQFASR